MKRLLLLSLAIFVLLEVIGSLSADWFGYPYSYQTVVIYLYMFLQGWLDIPKRAAPSMGLGNRDPYRLAPHQRRRTVTEVMGIDVNQRDMPPSSLSVRLLDAIVRLPVMAFWSWLGGFIYKVFILEEKAAS